MMHPIDVRIKIKGMTIKCDIVFLSSYALAGFKNF